MKNHTGMLLTLLLAIVIGACTNESYESGDGKYSYLRADFCMVHTADSSLADYAVTDADETIPFASPVHVGWATTSDSLYRALVYYNTSTRQVFSVSQVSVVTPKSRLQLVAVPTDPMTLESVWVSGGYLNIRFALKTGTSENIDAQQQIGLVLDSVSISATGRQVYYLRLLHAQNGVPEYYSVHGYMSMPITAAMSGATLNLTINTYNGVKTVVVGL